MSTAIQPRVIREIPQELKDFQQSATICNILREPVLPIIHSTFGIFHIAVPEPGERYALTPVSWAPMYMDKGDSLFNVLKGRGHKDMPVEDNRIKLIQGAYKIAEDLCQQMNTSDGPAGESANSPFWGKFVCAGDEPTEAELVTAEKRMRTYFLRVVEVGDTVWAKAGRHDMIDSRCKIAARVLNVTDRAWLMDYVPNTECPACKEPIRAGAKLCRFCGTIIDGDSITIVGASSETKARRTGRSAKRKPEPLPTL